MTCTQLCTKYRKYTDFVEITDFVIQLIRRGSKMEQ